jgi:4,4'-diaponeurosporenoate glycosyltransferase
LLFFGDNDAGHFSVKIYDGEVMLEIVVFGACWASGWFVMWSTRSFQVRNTDLNATAVTVIIPARNEERNVHDLLISLNKQLHTGDQVVVVDDGSTDNTASLARDLGATVCNAGTLPSGWAGKAHACWVGAQIATHDVLLFVDADVRFSDQSTQVVAELGQRVRENPQVLCSVQPWHDTVAFEEQASMLFNIVSVMGSAMKTLKPLVFGPILACSRNTYLAVGGHSHQQVRGQVVEDIALGNLFLTADVSLGSPATATFRMYPQGILAVIRGFSKNIAQGSRSVPFRRRLLIAAWCASLVGGVLTSPWMYLLSLIQVAIFAKQVGRFHPLVVAVFPLHMLLFTFVVARSYWSAVLLGRANWSGRTIRTR